MIEIEGIGEVNEFRILPVVDAEGVPKEYKLQARLYSGGYVGEWSIVKSFSDNEKASRIKAELEKLNKLDK